MKSFFFLFFSSLLFFSCPKVPSNDFKLGESIVLNLNTPTRISSEKIQMILTSVEESRCPKDLNCIRAGEAYANIDFMLEDMVTSVKLKAEGGCMEETGGCGNSKTVLGYNVKLLYIYPYPMNNPPSGKDFSAKVILSKK